MNLFQYSKANIAKKYAWVSSKTHSVCFDNHLDKTNKLISLTIQPLAPSICSSISYWTYSRFLFFFKKEVLIKWVIQVIKCTSLVCKHFNSLSTIRLFSLISFVFTFFWYSLYFTKNNMCLHTIQFKCAFVQKCLEKNLYECSAIYIFLYSSLTGCYTIDEHVMFVN
jgi:hypothetical protein